jgi:hypothetical protein
MSISKKGARAISFNVGITKGIGMAEIAGSNAASSTHRSSGGTAAQSRSDTIGSIAQSMVDANRTGASVDTDKLGRSIAELKTTLPADVSAELQVAVEAKLSPVQAGEVRAAIANAPAANQLSDVSNTLRVPSAYEAEQIKIAELCGLPRPEFTYMSAPQQPLPGKMTTEQFIDHMDKLTSGTFSSIGYNIAYLSGADQKTMDLVYGLGLSADGFADGITGGMAQQQANRDVTPGL